MSIIEQIVQDGYKQTEVGVIPLEWHVLKVDDFSLKVGSGKTPTGGASVYVDSGRPFVRSQNVGSGNLRLSDLAYITEETHSTFTGSEIKTDDVLLNITGASIGRCALASPMISGGNVNQHVCIIRTNSTKVHPYLLQTLINSDTGQQQIDSYQAGGNREGLNFSQVRNMQFAFSHDIKEQTAIANALSDVDALITELEKLIEKKQAIKTATMQQLLTGKTRLPQFATYTEGEKKSLPKGTKPSELGEIPEDWDVVSIAKLTKNIIDYRGRTPKKLGMDWGGGDIVALSAGNVKKGYIDFEEECYLGSNELYKKWMKNGDVEQNDIVFTMEAPLGNVALVPDSKRYILSQRTILLQLKREEYESTFVYQLMMSDQFQKLLSDSATGSTAPGIKRTRFEQLLLCLPSSKEEQTAIATILSDMDNETQTLEQRLAKTRQVKQGMMQELLTGRTRLPF
jgi:type I restriction enzyme S subunit